MTTYHYDAGGALTGWTRTRGGISDEYTAEGLRVLTPATGAEPARADAVAYPLRRLPDGTLGLDEVSAAAP